MQKETYVRYVYTVESHYSEAQRGQKVPYIKYSLYMYKSMHTTLAEASKVYTETFTISDIVIYSTSYNILRYIYIKILL